MVLSEGQAEKWKTLSSLFFCHSRGAAPGASNGCGVNKTTAKATKCAGATLIPLQILRREVAPDGVVVLVLEVLAEQSAKLFHLQR